MEFLFGYLDLLICLDDLLGYSNDTSSLLDTLRSVFQVCKDKVLKLNTAKYQVVTDEVQFCGRIINKKVLNFILVNMKLLKPCQLQQLLGTHGACTRR